MIGNRSFCSKILLFGEYSIIKNSMALSIPYRLFEGQLKFRSSDEIGKGLRRGSPDPELKPFGQYLQNLADKGELFSDLDVESFQFDISQGLYFDSTIPQGYGVGSSGALCAAVFDVYNKNDRSQFDILSLKEIFSQLESHFHGASSGLDPLISYLDRPVLLKDKTHVGTVDMPSFEKGKGGIFLLSTGRPRRTEPLVNLFLEKCKDREFESLCQNTLIPSTNNCIECLLEGQIAKLWREFENLSLFQYKHFLPMIPNLYQGLYKQGLEHGDFFLKLCGAGGGGFIMGMTRDFSKVKSTLGQYEYRPVLYF